MFTYYIEDLGLTANHVSTQQNRSVFKAIRKWLTFFDHFAVFTSDGWLLLGLQVFIKVYLFNIDLEQTSKQQKMNVITS